MQSAVSSHPSSSQSLFEHAFECAPIGMALVGPDGSFLKVNEAVCEITGYSETELLRRTFQDITHPDDLALDLANVRSMLANEIATYQMEKRYIQKKGALVWVRLSVSLVRDPAGTPEFFISQIEDITAQKEAERRLEEAAAEIKKLQSGLLKICAWTKRIYIDGHWMSVDDFLRDRLRLKLTHGMSVEGGRMFKEQ